MTTRNTGDRLRAGRRIYFYLFKRDWENEEIPVIRDDTEHISQEQEAQQDSSR